MTRKRVLSLIAAFALLLQIFSISISAATFDDVEDSSTAEAVEVLNVLGIINGKTNNTFAPNDAIRRSEIASIAVRMFNLPQDFAATPEAVFSDVGERNSAFKDIYIANKLGLVQGAGDGKFYPMQNVTYAQAIKIIVNVLGYDKKAQLLGGYPSGYLVVASQLGLLKNVKIEGDDIAATRADIAKIIYRALSVDLMQKNKYGADGDKLEIIEGESLLTEMFGCTLIKGVVTENENTSFSLTQTAKTFETVVAGNLLYSETSNIKDYIGYNVKAYYKLDDLDRKSIVTFLPINKDEIKITNANEFEATLSGDKIHFEYFEEGAAKAKKVSADASKILLNGKMHAPAPTQTWLDSVFDSFEGGTLTLVDNDGDNEYDFISIKDAESSVVERVDTLAKKIAYKKFDGANTKGTYLLDKNAGKKVDYKIINDKGEEIELSAVAQGNALTMFASEDGLLCEIHVSKQSVKGEISEIDSDNKVTLGEKKYRLADGFSPTLISLGMETTFVLDANGCIVGFDEVVEKDNYALLMNVFIPERGIDNYPELRLLTPDGKMQTVKTEWEVSAFDGATVSKQPISNLICHERVLANYTNVSPYMLWYTDNAKNFIHGSGDKTLFTYRPWLTEEEKSDIASRKPIYYEKNGEGRITKILVPDIPSPECKIRSLNTYQGQTRYKWRLRNTNMTATVDGFPIYYRISDDVIGYRVFASNYAEGDYTVTAKPVDEGNRKSMIYELDNSGKVDMVIGYDSFPIDQDASFVIVDSVSAKIDGGFTLRGFSNGAAYTAIIAENTRLIERMPQFRENGAWQKVTASNLESVMQRALSDRAVYEDTAFGNQKLPTPYVDETNLHKGDILSVGKNGGSKITYVEVVMRAEDCVLLFPSASNSFTGRMKYDRQITKGRVTGFDDEMFLVRSIGQNGSEYRSISEANSKVTIDFDEIQPYHLRYSGCRIWEFDYATGKAQVINADNISEGDVLVIFGKTYNPKQCIVLRNYTAEPRV